LHASRRDERSRRRSWTQKEAPERLIFGTCYFGMCAPCAAAQVPRHRPKHVAHSPSHAPSAAKAERERGEGRREGDDGPMATINNNNFYYYFTNNAQKTVGIRSEMEEKENGNPPASFYAHGPISLRLGVIRLSSHRLTHALSPSLCLSLFLSFPVTLTHSSFLRPSAATPPPSPSLHALVTNHPRQMSAHLSPT
jgi:hypothetical protein